MKRMVQSKSSQKRSRRLRTGTRLHQHEPNRQTWQVRLHHRHQFFHVCNKGILKLVLYIHTRRKLCNSGSVVECAPEAVFQWKISCFLTFARLVLICIDLRVHLPTTMTWKWQRLRLTVTATAIVKVVTTKVVAMRNLSPVVLELQ